MTESSPSPMASRTLRAWEGISVAEVDGWDDPEFWRVWRDLKEIVPSYVDIRGLCPVDGDPDVRWAALAWSPGRQIGQSGQTWRGLGKTKKDAVLALIDMILREMIPSAEQLSRGAA